MGVKGLSMILLRFFMIPRCSGYLVVPDEIHENGHPVNIIYSY